MENLTDATRKIKKLAMNIYLPCSHLDKILTTCNRYLTTKLLCSEENTIKDIKFSCLLLKDQILTIENLINNTINGGEQ